MPASSLPTGATLEPLAGSCADSGSITLERAALRYAQINMVCSDPGVLRGLHVHAFRSDAIVVVSGRVLVVLADVRDEAASRAPVLFEMNGETPECLIVPVGVVHGFYSFTSTRVLYGLSEEWDPEDEAGCRWDDPALAVPWPTPDPTLSPRDVQLGAYEDMVREWKRYGKMERQGR